MNNFDPSLCNEVLGDLEGLLEFAVQHKQQIHFRECLGIIHSSIATLQPVDIPDTEEGQQVKSRINALLVSLVNAER